MVGTYHKSKTLTKISDGFGIKVNDLSLVEVYPRDLAGVPKTHPDLSPREILWIRAKELNPHLGNLLQNPMKLTLKDVAMEIQLVNILKGQLTDYIKNLDKLMEMQNAGSHDNIPESDSTD